jgi:hypothetical protein
VIDAVWTDKSWHAFAMRFGTEKDNVYVVVAVGSENMSRKQWESVSRHEKEKRMWGVSCVPLNVGRI